MDPLEVRVAERAKMMLRVLVHLAPSYPTPQTVDVGIAVETKSRSRPEFGFFDPEWEMARSTCQQMMGGAIDAHVVDASTFTGTLSAFTHARLMDPSPSGTGTVLDEISALLAREEAGQPPSSIEARTLVVAAGCASPSLLKDPKGAG